MQRVENALSKINADDEPQLGSDQAPGLVQGSDEVCFAGAPWVPPPPTEEANAPRPPRPPTAQVAQPTERQLSEPALAGIRRVAGRMGGCLITAEGEMRLKDQHVEIATRWLFPVMYAVAVLSLGLHFN